MKRKVFIIAVWITGLFLGSFLYLPKTQAYPLDYQIKAEVSSSIETLQVFYLLKNQSGYSQCEYENTIFKKLSLEWFVPYSNHKAVQDFKEVISIQYTQEELIDIFSQFTLNSSGLFDLSSSSIGKDQQLSTWFKDVNNFLVESQSGVFFSRMKDYYNLLPDTLGSRTSFMMNLQKMISFFNVQQCKVYITPTLMHQFYLYTNHDENNMSFTIILGLQSIDNGYISFTSSSLQQDLLYSRLLNQCLQHSLEKYQSNIDDFVGLWPSIQESMKKENIETWSQAFQEHLRISLLAKLFPDSYTHELYQQKTESGYQYLPITAGIVEGYLRFRPYYRSFHSLMPKVILKFYKYPA